jgi:hypothetical protein
MPERALRRSSIEEGTASSGVIQSRAGAGLSGGGHCGAISEIGAPSPGVAGVAVQSWVGTAWSGVIQSWIGGGTSASGAASGPGVNVSAAGSRVGGDDSTVGADDSKVAAEEVGVGVSSLGAAYAEDPVAGI